MTESNQERAFSLLGIMTLEDISGLVSYQKSSKSRVKLSDLVTKQLKSKEKKLQSREIEIQHQEQSQKQEKAEDAILDEKIERIKEKDKITLDKSDLMSKMDNLLTGDEEENIQRSDGEGELDRNVFILDTQRKLKSIRKRMRIKEIYKSYKDNSAIDLTMEKSKDQEGSSESQTAGILVNKKHY